jgi:hypothetical protein
MFSLRLLRRPGLSSFNYAETKYEEIATLVNALKESPSTKPVRLLLLSRSAGLWWDYLTADVLGPDAAEKLVLTALTKDEAGRRSAYSTAVSGLARHLSALLPDIQPTTLRARPLLDIAASSSRDRSRRFSSFSARGTCLPLLPVRTRLIVGRNRASGQVPDRA